MMKTMWLGLVHRSGAPDLGFSNNVLNRFGFIHQFGFHANQYPPLLWVPFGGYGKLECSQRGPRPRHLFYIFAKIVKQNNALAHIAGLGTKISRDLWGP